MENVNIKCTSVYQLKYYTEVIFSNELCYNRENFNLQMHILIMRIKDENNNIMWKLKISKRDDDGC